MDGDELLPGTDISKLPAVGVLSDYYIRESNNANAILSAPSTSWSKILPNRKEKVCEQVNDGE